MAVASSPLVGSLYIVSICEGTSNNYRMIGWLTVRIKSSVRSYGTDENQTKTRRTTGRAYVPTSQSVFRAAVPFLGNDVGLKTRFTTN